MTIPNIQAAKARLDKSVASQRELRKRIARSAAELRGDVEEPSDANVEIKRAEVGNGDG